MTNKNYLPSVITLLWSALLLAFTLSLVGCGTQGYPHVDTTRKAIIVATAEVRAANLLLQDLIQRNAISPSQARNALSDLQRAKDNLQTALSAIDIAGDPITANDNLQRANSALSLAMILLAPLVEGET